MPTKLAIDDELLTEAQKVGATLGSFDCPTEFLRSTRPMRFPIRFMESVRCG